MLVGMGVGKNGKESSSGNLSLVLKIGKFKHFPFTTSVSTSVLKVDSLPNNV